MASHIKYFAARTLRAVGSVTSQARRQLPGEEYYSVPGHHVFFGYYDITPFNPKETRILANKLPPINRTPKPDDSLSVGYFNLHEGSKFVEVGRTETWCWQQGCRLQWFPSGEGKELAIYNKFLDGAYGSVVQDMSDGRIFRQYADPIYALGRDAKTALTLDFSRLQRLRPGYGYVNLTDATAAEEAPDSSGIWKINMENGEKTLLFSIREISSMQGRQDMAGAHHYFNHICFNPSSSRFLFFHLWDKGGKRSSRLITADAGGKNAYVVENSRNVSHYTWKSDDEILYTRSSGDGRVEYVLCRDMTGEEDVVGTGQLTTDGHPTYFNGENRILTDTYPDILGFRKLVIYDVDRSHMRTLSSFHSPYEFRGETRCDLHPRLSPSGKFVSIDMIQDNVRKCLVANLQL